jgi:phenylacetic acid degradation protein
VRLSPQETAWKRQGTGVYRGLAAEARDKLVPADPGTAPEPDRRRIRAPGYGPLFLERLKFCDG